MDAIVPSANNSLRQAAEAMSTILSRRNIHHAVIGGVAVLLLGHERQTSDLDVVIDVKNAEELDLVSDYLIEGDARFSKECLKLYFTPSEGQQSRVLIERLPIGSLGLPTQLNILRPGLVPVLHPRILILTKIKRCSWLIESTRPKSRLKFLSDESDIEFLIEWLVEHDEKIDFVGYQSPDMDRLYTAVQKMVKFWERTGKEEKAQRICLVLENRDRERIMR
ncbi:hypothetical protein DCS_07351 [Drechmeria coniospora]|uniref:Uncharacterized protein n=1 Tax=Drechmeria coniospora TaxID=98403 RepID=A0A151GE75_DRECN|nr:hypothetical protein DCS_07351 [Drechmeria coniospora]KYK55388.1 hypothetical protein DCS_07351 [Drechmeria coniospora]